LEARGEGDEEHRSTGASGALRGAGDIYPEWGKVGKMYFPAQDAVSPARDVLDAAVLKEMDTDVSPLRDHFMARLISPETWTERVRHEKSHSLVSAGGRAGAAADEFVLI